MAMAEGAGRFASGGRHKTPAPQAVKPEQLTSLELGMKNSFLDGSVRLNAAVFQNQIKNGQVFFF